MNQSGRMEKVRQALDRLAVEVGVGPYVAAALAEVEERETRLEALLADKGVTWKIEYDRAETAEAEADRLKQRNHELRERIRELEAALWPGISGNSYRAPADRNTT